MGDNTPNFDFYLINDEDAVDADNDLNYNLKKIDKVMSLIDYRVVDSSVIESDSSIPKSQGYKYYKRFTNSVWVCRGTQIYQDPNSQVDTWNVNIGPFAAGYGSQDQAANRIAVTSFNGFVTFRGHLVLNNGSTDLPANTVVNFLTVPTSILPTRPRYFTVGGGHSTGSPIFFRIYVPAVSTGDPRIEFIKYGGAASAAAERFIDLSQVRYPINDSVPV